MPPDSSILPNPQARPCATLALRPGWLASGLGVGARTGLHAELTAYSIVFWGHDALPAQDMVAWQQEKARLMAEMSLAGQKGAYGKLGALSSGLNRAFDDHIELSLRAGAGTHVRTEEVQALLKRIGVDGVRYEEIFITSFDGDVLGLYDHLGEYESIDELNHLAHVLSDLDQSDIEKFEAVIDSGEYTGSVHDLINLAQNLDCYDFYPGIDSEEALGRAYIEEMEMLDVPDNVLPYFDFEAYGRDVRINEGGHFAPGGYVFNNGGSFVERYHGMEDIPPEHRIFAYPKLNIREQMAAYQEVIDRSALNEEKLRLPTSREDR